MSGGFRTDPVLAARGVRHGFGLRGAHPPRGLVRPRQVHGCAVARVWGGRAEPREADAIVSSDPAHPVAVVTADCLPILLCSESGEAVAAVHAGWRGLAAGVVGAGVEALLAAARGAELRAAIGPHIGRCCYEVDEPVLARLRLRFGAELAVALVPTRPGCGRLDLGALARAELARAGIAADAVGTAAVECTRCDPERFYSYRRDGPGAGRLVSYIAPAPGPADGLDTPRGPA